MGRIGKVRGNRSGVPPKYRRLSDFVLGQIEAGVWKPGDRLPSETELAARVPASLGTVQKALNTLAAQGVVVRRHGRGTFVAGAKAPHADLRYFRFLSEGGREILPIFSRVIAVDETADQGPWVGFLGREGSYVRLQRILSVDAEFELFSEMYLSGRRFRVLLERPLEEFDGVLIRDYLSEHFNTPTLRVEQTLRCAALPPRVCNLIHVARGTVGLIWCILSRSYRDAPLIFQRAYVPPSDRSIQFPDRL